IEDQQLTKKCVHLNGKILVTAEEMAQKISVIKQVAPSLVVIARTDAHAVEGLESAIERTKLYVEAGADGVFPEALESNDDFQAFSEQVTVPLLANMNEFVHNPYISTDEFETLGYAM